MPPLDLTALRRRLPPNPVTRFAPSPTGLLHLGHVANAVYVWGVARALGGRVLLRIEDHDRGRSREPFERAILEDLEWLGLVPDLGTFDELRRGVSAYRQSDRGERYASMLNALASSAKVYACDCSRREIALEGGDAFNEETRYAGRCRDRELPLADGRGIRVVMEPGEERFDDALAGTQTQIPADQCGDLLLRDRNGNWTYQYAVVVDDMEHGVDLVIRGEDLLSSTGRQLRLARLLGRERMPVFLHHPLIRKPDGAKLSKSSGDTGIADLRKAGVRPEAVLGEAAWRTGVIGERRAVRVGELAGLFSVSP